MATIIINPSLLATNVGIIDAQGNACFVRVMSRGGRVTLAEGEKVDQNWLALYGQHIKVVEQTPVLAPIPEQVPEVTTTSTKSTASSKEGETQ